MGKAEQVRAMFGRITPRYDLLNRVLSMGLDRSWRRRAVAELGLGPGQGAVDLCCGSGDLAAEIAAVTGPEGVVGVDFCEPMLAEARRKYPGIRFVAGDALQVPLGEEFDAATVAFGLRNVESLPRLFAEMARLVRPGGRVLSLELTRPPGLLGVLHGLFLRLVVPLVGLVVSGDPGAYRYLARTIAEFPAPAEVARVMEEAGLREVRVIPLTGGIVTLHVGLRP